MSTCSTSHPLASSPCPHPRASSPCPHPRASSPCPHPRASSPCPHPRASSPCPHPRASSACSHPWASFPCPHPQDSKRGYSSVWPRWLPVVYFLRENGAFWGRDVFLLWEDGGWIHREGAPMSQTWTPTLDYPPHCSLVH
uniref:Uncharacterized protein n=1 Tax=Hucho hucho TaxID=62062 RepID=A0A4W5N4L8_9TELE